ncbi:hypothetical protein JB92DRAFT_3127129 [Gautieria morchelliformis]|nr:hypothetical protein JB92DRAFT_3127129 [Gautieria morchelliformis]
MTLEEMEALLQKKKEMHQEKDHKNHEEKERERKEHELKEKETKEKERKDHDEKERLVQEEQDQEPEQKHEDEWKRKEAAREKGTPDKAAAENAAGREVGREYWMPAELTRASKRLGDETPGVKLPDNCETWSGYIPEEDPKGVPMQDAVGEQILKVTLNCWITGYKRETPAALDVGKKCKLPHEDPDTVGDRKRQKIAKSEHISPNTAKPKPEAATLNRFSIVSPLIDIAGTLRAMDLMQDAKLKGQAEISRLLHRELPALSHSWEQMVEQMRQWKNIMDAQILPMAEYDKEQEAQWARVRSERAGKTGGPEKNV